jgi:hypothetical protein
LDLRAFSAGIRRAVIIRRYTLAQVSLYLRQSGGSHFALYDNVSDTRVLAKSQFDEPECCLEGEECDADKLSWDSPACRLRAVLGLSDQTPTDDDFGDLNLR